MNMKKTYSGIARSTSGSLRRPERADPTSPTSIALKRSFEVEEDASTNPSPLSRRTANPLRSTSSTNSRFHDMSSRNSESTSRHASDSSSNHRSPKSGLRRMELSGSRVPETASRRTEISIDISSKQVDSSPSPGIARFGLRRPEVSLQSKATDPLVHRRADGTSRPQEPPTPPRRADPPVPVSRIPEQSQRRVEPPSPLEISAPPRRPEMHINRQLDTPSPARESENSFTSAASVTPTFTEYKTPPSVHEIPIRPPERSEVISSYSSSSIMTESVISEMPPAMFLEKPSMDFSYVGIDAILEQMRRKAMKQGFELNIMVVGQSGLGKSTLMNTLFKSKVSRKSVLGTAEEKIPKTIEIKSISHDIEEKGVRMKLTVIDTPGFGDQINNENCWQPIMKFINDQYEQYLQEEINIDRKKRIPDSRVHCCIYFIPPTGHCLRPLDVEFMRRLSKVVNIVPVIAKADTLTLEERDFFKKKIREELRANGIDVYPQKEFDEDAEDRMINEKIREMIPFAVVGSDQEYQVNGRRLLGRKTKWGTIEVENIAHCEFAYLRDLLIRTHMQNIKDITSSIHYEMYRVRRLNENNTQANGLGEHHPASHEI
ncbi:neuronal-specific septin-3-like isoform X2 [Myxocyprinus asiaticus]|uniref:neuronal-specific septin-3-like isoform X2 n=1 Tax=Myxocyprinus asiaticus TaxID=70543 RepID=UPI0022212F57|nr:neuronal-specific septin-3-like isoform X2 [Myxocyprinus asiaticus]